MKPIRRYLFIHGPSVGLVALQAFSFLWSLLGVTLHFPGADAALVVFAATLLLATGALWAEEA